MILVMTMEKLHTKFAHGVSYVNKLINVTDCRNANGRQPKHQ